MNDNDIDRYRIRQLAVFDPDYQPIPWDQIPAEARASWRKRFTDGWTA